MPSTSCHILSLTSVRLFQPHSASKNHSRVPRFITNPPVTLKEPLNFDRKDPADYVSPFAVVIVYESIDHALRSLQSLVELKILRSLGVDSLPRWHIVGPRRRFTPRTRANKDAMIMEEVERMKAHAHLTGGNVDSMHLNGPVPYQVIVARG